MTLLAISQFMIHAACATSAFASLADTGESGVALPPADPGNSASSGFVSTLFAGSPTWFGPTVGTAALLLGIWLVVSQLRAAAKARAEDARPPDEPTPMRRGRKQSDASPAGNAAATQINAADLRSLQEELDQLLADLDARATRLEGLIAKAEVTIGTLQAEIRHAETMPRESIEAKPRVRVTPPEPLISDPVHQQVYQLSDAGYGPVDIARRLQQPTGQVELILALRRR